MIKINTLLLQIDQYRTNRRDKIIKKKLQKC